MKNFSFLLVFAFIFISTPLAFAQLTYGSDQILEVNNSSVFVMNGTASGDFDNDGDLDVVAISRTQNRELVWYENIGNQNFGPETPLNYTSSLDPRSISCADIDADGFIDIVLGTQNQHFWYKNMSNGNFTIQPVSGSGLISNSLTEDIDNDGEIDIIYRNTSGVYWYENLGSGVFNWPSQITSSTSSAIKKMRLNDIDNDNDLDLVILKNTSIYWYENLGAGVFGAEQLIGSTWANSLKDFFVADLDNDTLPDIIAVSSTATIIMISKNLGGNSFQTTTWQSNNFHYYNTLYVEDISNDGYKDLIVARKDGSIYSFLNLGNGNLNFSPSIIAGNNADVTELHMPDLNADGVKDLLFISNDFNMVFWVDSLGNGSGGDSRPITASSRYTQYVSCADMDNDGYDDIISSARNKFGWYRNTGNGDFEIQRSISTSVMNPQSMMTIDLDGDTDLDLLAAASNNPIVWVENLGNGDFGPQRNISSGSGSSYDAFSIDLDGDGDNDVLATYFGTSKITWHENLGSGTFGPENVIDNSVKSRVIYAFDIDNDGDADVISASDLNQSIYWYENLGTGTFGIAQVITNISSSLLSIYASDLDGDGDTDLLTSSSSNNEICSYENLGNGTFGVKEIIGSYASPVFDVYASDLDGDGDNDITAGLAETNYQVIYYENLGNGIFSPLRGISDTISAGYKVRTADFDHDGDLDVAHVSPADGKITWHENLHDNPTISGYIFYDENQNGIKDGIEKDLESIQSNIQPLQLGVFPNPNGVFSYAVANGNYAVSYDSVPEWLLTTDSSSYNVLIDTANTNVNNLFFGFFPTDTVNELTISINSGHTRCEEFVNFDFNLKNVGTSILEGVLWIQVDTNIQDTSMISLADTIIDMYSFGFNFSNVYPGELITNSVELQMPALGGTLVLGDSIIITASAVLSNNDTVSHTYSPLVFCSFDPNDKQVSPMRPGSDNFTSFDEELMYTIRFQNTGNDTAYNVVIKDTLDPNLNPATFQLISSSDPYILHTSISNDEFITFDFTNIMLPDSGADYSGSQGYVTYTIEPNDSLPENTVINNTASIYFDTNPPIVTNTTINTLVTFIPCENVDTLSSVTACDSVLLNNNWYFTSQFVMDTMEINNVCQSISATPLIINESTYSTMSDLTACDSVFVNNNWYYASQALSVNYGSSNGCDSIVTRNLIINNSSTETNDVVSCDSIQFDNNWYYSSQTLIDNFNTIEGCDSTITTNLIINQANSSIIFDTISAGTSYVLPNGNSVDSSGTYLVQLQTVNNCDSVLSIHLFVNEDVGIKPHQLNAKNWHIHPNPSSTFFVVSFENKQEAHLIEIYSVIGKKVLSKELDKETKIETQNWTDGMYNVVIKNEQGELIGTKQVVILK